MASSAPEGAARPQIPGVPAEETAAAGRASSNAQAWREAASLTRDASPEDLASDAASQEHDRSQRFKNNFEWMAIGGLWLGAVAVAAVGGVWLWHMAAPSRWRWLTGEDVSHLQSIMTAGLLVGVIGNHFKKRLE